MPITSLFRDVSYETDISVYCEEYNVMCKTIPHQTQFEPSHTEFRSIKNENCLPAVEYIIYSIMIMVERRIHSKIDFQHDISVILLNIALYYEYSHSNLPRYTTKN